MQLCRGAAGAAAVVPARAAEGGRSVGPWLAAAAYGAQCRPAAARTGPSAELLGPLLRSPARTKSPSVTTQTRLLGRSLVADLNTKYQSQGLTK